MLLGSGGIVERFSHFSGISLGGTASREVNFCPLVFVRGGKRPRLPTLFDKTDYNGTALAAARCCNQRARLSP